jgi:hypothetical protein
MPPQRSLVTFPHTKSEWWIRRAQGRLFNLQLQDKLMRSLSDTFTGTYASEYLRQKSAGKWDIKSAVIRANKASALTIGRLGAQEGIPWDDEIDQLNADFSDPEISTPSFGDQIV